MIYKILDEKSVTEKQINETNTTLPEYYVNVNYKRKSKIKEKIYINTTENGVELYHGYEKNKII